MTTGRINQVASCCDFATQNKRTRQQDPETKERGNCPKRKRGGQHRKNEASEETKQGFNPKGGPATAHTRATLLQESTKQAKGRINVFKWFKEQAPRPLGPGRECQPLNGSPTFRTVDRRRIENLEGYTESMHREHLQSHISIDTHQDRRQTKMESGMEAHLVGHAIPSQRRRGRGNTDIIRKNRKIPLRGTSYRQTRL